MITNFDSLCILCACNCMCKYISYRFDLYPPTGTETSSVRPNVSLASQAGSIDYRPAGGERGTLPKHTLWKTDLSSQKRRRLDLDEKFDDNSTKNAGKIRRYRTKKLTDLWRKTTVRKCQNVRMGLAKNFVKFLLLPKPPVKAPLTTKPK